MCRRWNGISKTVGSLANVSGIDAENGNRSRTKNDLVLIEAEKNVRRVHRKLRSFLFSLISEEEFAIRTNCCFFFSSAVIDEGEAKSAVYRFCLHDDVYAFINTRSKLFSNSTTGQPESIVSTHTIVR